MSARGQEFKGIFPSSEEKPKGPPLSVAAQAFLRDNFTIATWLCFGAFAQTILYVIADKFNIGRLSLLPVIGILAYKTLNVYFMSIGWKRNIYMDGVIQKKTSTAIPDSSGRYGSKPADSEVVVFMIGTRSNHPLGLLAPGYSDMLQYFGGMAETLETHRDEFGFLGMTSWTNSSIRTTNSEIMQVCYFKSISGLHAFAHSKHHRPAWDWWNKTIKQHPHLSIYHETYHVPKGHWETIYVNSHVSGINSTLHRVTDEMTGKQMWATPIVDASKGLLKTIAGRMSRSNAEEHDGYEDPYDL